MSRRKHRKEIFLTDLLELLPGKLRSPLGVIMGPSREVADFLAARDEPGDLCYHMDLYQAELLQGEIDMRGGHSRIVTAPDLWDLPEPLQTLVYPVPMRGERELKLDMIEQAFHALVPHGTLVVLSPYDNDQFFPQALKKIYGKVHTPTVEGGMLLWCHRDGDRPRRRHEVTFQVRRGEGGSLRFLSRPGVFSYGRFDQGARALVEVMEVGPGDKILDIGCGCGTNGVHAALRAGPDSKTVFVDSNLRALALTEYNAAANGLQHFRTVATSKVAEVGRRDFDVALANPPYFAQQNIARLFIERARDLLSPEGRLYLVTKQPDEVGRMVIENFAEAEVVLHRGYSIVCATGPAQ